MRIIYSILVFLVSCMVCMGEGSPERKGNAREVHECASILTEKKVKAFKDGTSVEVELRKYCDAEQNIYKIEIQQENNIDQKCVLLSVSLATLRPISSDPNSDIEFGPMSDLYLPWMTEIRAPQKMEFDIYNYYRECKKESTPPYDVTLMIQYSKFNKGQKENLFINFDL